MKYEIRVAPDKPVCMVKRLALVGLLALISLAHAQVEVSELIEYATENRSDILAAEKNRLRCKHEEDAILCGMLPQVSIVTYLQQSQKFLHLGEYFDALPFVQAQFTITQSFIDPVGPLHTIYRARQASEIAYRSSVYTIYDCQFAVERAYLSYAQNMFEEKYRREQKAAAEIAFAHAKSKYMQGLLSIEAFQQARFDFDAVDADVRNYWCNRCIGEYGIVTSTEMNVDPKQLQMPVPASLEQFLSGYAKRMCDVSGVEDYYDIAVNNNAGLALQDAKIRAAEIEVGLLRASTLPSISFFASIFQQRFGDAPRALAVDPQTDNLPLLGVYPWSFGFKMTWNFDGFTTLHRVRAQRAKYLEELLNKKHAEYTLKGDLQRANSELQIAQEQIRALKTKKEHELTAFAKQKKAYEVGLLSVPKFAQATAALEQVQSEIDRAILQAAAKYQELLYNMGYPDKYRTALQENVQDNGQDSGHNKQECA
jgi:outer membrane protein TolC